ncbi:MAG: SH3 domain-containing protein [Desulfobacterales bacterium]|jgi:SH3-like domain-containing protein
MAIGLLLSASSAYGERLSVAVSKANVRSGPGTKGYDILWEVERYHPIEVVQKSDGWILFRDFEGDKGWIHQKLLSTQTTVITQKNDCNIRSRPGTDGDILFRAERGVPFKVLERKEEWIQIQSIDGDKGWIHQNLVW